MRLRTRRESRAKRARRRHVSADVNQTTLKLVRERHSTYTEVTRHRSGASITIPAPADAKLALTELGF